MDIPEGAASPGQPEPVPGQPAPVGTSQHQLWRHLAVYTGLRLALVGVIAALLSIFMPLIVALLFAIIVQLPLAWLLFSGPRAKVNDAMAQASAKRRAERDRLQSALSGE